MTSFCQETPLVGFGPLSRLRVMYISVGGKQIPWVPGTDIYLITSTCRLVIGCHPINQIFTQNNSNENMVRVVVVELNEKLNYELPIAQ